MQSKDADVAQLVQINHNQLLIAGRSFPLEEVQTVQVVRALPARYAHVARISGALWALIVLAWIGVFFFTGGSGGDEWLYLLLLVAILLPVLYNFVSNLEPNQHEVSSALFWGFAWVVSPGLVALYLLNIRGLELPDDVWLSLAIYGTAVLGALNLLVSLQLLSPANKAVFMIRITHANRCSDVFSSSDESLIVGMSNVIRMSIKSTKGHLRES